MLLRTFRILYRQERSLLQGWKVMVASLCWIFLAQKLGYAVHFVFLKKSSQWCLATVHFHLLKARRGRKYAIYKS
jgi:hypothetical protein